MKIPVNTSASDSAAGIKYLTFTNPLLTMYKLTQILNFKPVRQFLFPCDHGKDAKLPNISVTLLAVPGNSNINRK